MTYREDPAAGRHSGGPAITSLADAVSARLARAGFDYCSPELVAIRDHNTAVLARRLATKGDACQGWPGCPQHGSAIGRWL